jgi:energy-coupling factor transporter ATP-binding protein EcfA2
MAIVLKKVTLAPLQAITASVPNSALVGILGEKGSGKRALLRVAAGIESPASGSVSAGKNRRYLGPADELNFSPADALLLEHTLARCDAVEREQAALALDRCRRQGATILLVSHDEPLLRRLCDEVWWLHEGKLMGRGDPAAMIDNYRDHVAGKLRAAGAAAATALSTALRSGDGRAEIVAVETLGSNWQPTAVWRSGEPVQVRVSVKFNREVANPVIGLMIRSRIGVEVYGTNTELEKVVLGKRAAGELVRVTFRFNCDLCPQDYTLTAASHDPNGTRHDWLEEAALISVTDSRYTAGVANLRAQVTLG